MEIISKKRKIKLVSFADGAFKNRKDQFIKEAEAMGLFDEITVFDAAMLPALFKEKHMSFMHSNSRGYGYWIWKPVVIYETLTTVSVDDIVVYLDVGFTLNSEGRERFLEYIDIVLDSQYKMLSFQNVHTEYKWTKMDLLKRLGVENRPSIINTSQLGAGFIILGKTKSNMELIQEWQNLAVESNYKYSDDSESALPNHPGFIEHRHDLSISSMLRKIRGTEVSHYEVQSYAGFFDKNKHLIPAWATRLRT